MQILKDTCLTWWQVGMLKWSVFGIGLIVGAFFSEWVWTFLWPILFVIIICTVYITLVWWQQHNK